jgi:hypothetical protein
MPNQTTTKSGNQMTSSSASRIQSSQTKGGNYVGKGSFAARTQSAASKNSK